MQVTDFFKYCSGKFYKENDLSDITWAICRSSSFFKDSFLHFFFPDMNIKKDISMEREKSEDDSRPDFYINNGGEIYLIENKINDKNCFMNWLGEDKLIIMTGYTQDDIGHIWLVDGGYHIEARTMLIGSNDGLQWHFLRYFMKDSTYNHINWGWDGLCNGFFLYDVFDANNESEYDDGMINEIDDDLNFYRGTKYSLIYR